MRTPDRAKNVGTFQSQLTPRFQLIRDMRGTRRNGGRLPHFKKSIPASLNFRAVAGPLAGFLAEGGGKCQRRPESWSSHTPIWEAAEGARYFFQGAAGHRTGGKTILRAFPVEPKYARTEDMEGKCVPARLNFRDRGWRSRGFFWQMGVKNSGGGRKLVVTRAGLGGSRERDIFSKGRHRTGGKTILRASYAHGAAAQQASGREGEWRFSVLIGTLWLGTPAI